MIKRIKRLPLYFISIVVLLLVSFIFICTCSKAQGFLLLNTYHSGFVDILFRIVTNLGDGIVSILLAIILFILKKRKKAATLLIAYASSSLLVQIMKRIYDLPRPRLMLEQLNIDYPNFVVGVTLHDHHSFPSGHTASAFALATVMVLVFKKRKISIPCIVWASMVGYSRIYLAQHFLIDVLIGMFLGIICALMGYYQIYDLKLFRSLKAAKRLRRPRLQVTNAS